MKIKFYKPTSPSRRFTSQRNFADLNRKKPEKKLTIGKKRISGRNNSGKICIRFRGGGHKRRFRIIDFKRKKKIPAKVYSIEYDPNRSARISLLHYADGEKKYILTPRFIHIGDVIENSMTSHVSPGENMKIKDIPLGTAIHNIEIYPDKGGQLVRSAGTTAQLMAKDVKYSHIKMPSGEVRKILINCHATIGEVSNPTHDLIHYGKAGRKRWLGRRPHNRGVSMNPVDHPLGGGEGKSSGGRHPTSPWGKPSKGYKTRKNKRTNFVIIQKRKK